MNLVYKVVRINDQGEYGSVSVPDSNPFYARYYLGQTIGAGWKGSWFFAFTDLKEAIAFLREWKIGEPEDEKLAILACDASYEGMVEFFTNPGDPDVMIVYWNRILMGVPLDLDYEECIMRNCWKSSMYVSNLVPLLVVDWEKMYKVAAQNDSDVVLEDV
jgi:hypothetical protein